MKSQAFLDHLDRTDKELEKQDQKRVEPLSPGTVSKRWSPGFGYSCELKSTWQFFPLFCRSNTEKDQNLIKEQKAALLETAKQKAAEEPKGTEKQKEAEQQKRTEEQNEAGEQNGTGEQTGTEDQNAAEEQKETEQQKETAVSRLFCPSKV